MRVFSEPGYDVSRPGWFLVMGAVRVFEFGAAFAECLILFLFLSSPCKHGAISVPDYFVKKEL